MWQPRNYQAVVFAEGFSMFLGLFEDLYFLFSFPCHCFWNWRRKTSLKVPSFFLSLSLFIWFFTKFPMQLFPNWSLAAKVFSFSSWRELTNRQWIKKKKKKKSTKFSGVTSVTFRVKVCSDGAQIHFIPPFTTKLSHFSKKQIHKISTCFSFGDTVGKDGTSVGKGRRLPFQNILPSCLHKYFKWKNARWPERRNIPAATAGSHSRHTDTHTLNAAQVKHSGRAHVASTWGGRPRRKRGAPENKKRRPRGGRGAGAAADGLMCVVSLGTL